MTSPFDDAPDHVGRFKILRRLAQGGMAELFLARADGAVGFAKLVVVKRMLEEFSRHDDLVRMFVDEARLAGRLEHPNIVQVYEFGEEAGRFFYAMEFVQGENASTICKRLVQEEKPMPFDVAISIIAGAAAGLHYAHQMTGTDGNPLDVVHRDVSPHNLIVSYDGGVKVVDFGIAKTRAREADPTRAGAVKGKLAYMSPEQALCRPLDRRTDIFSLCIILWEMVAGRRLFASETTYATVAAVVEDPILPVSVYRPDAPPALEAVIQRGLSRDVAQRYPTALALREALDEVSRELQLTSSDLRLTRFMTEHFADRVSPWLQAKKSGEQEVVRHYSDPNLAPVALPDDDDDTGAVDPTQRTVPRGPTPRPLASPTLRGKVTVTPTPDLIVDPLLNTLRPFPDDAPTPVPERRTHAGPAPPDAAFELHEKSVPSLRSSGPPRVLVITAIGLFTSGLLVLTLFHRPPEIETTPITATPISATPITAKPMTAKPLVPAAAPPIAAETPTPVMKAPPIAPVAPDPGVGQKKKGKRGAKDAPAPKSTPPSARPFDSEAALPL